MPEEISLCEKTGIIYITSRGKIEEKDLLQSFESVLKISKDRANCRVLLDAREQTGLPNLAVLFNFGNKLSEQFRHFKHAIVVSEKSPNDLKFIETVSRNRGTNMKIFSSKEQALSWLDE